MDLTRLYLTLEEAEEAAMALQHEYEEWRWRTPGFCPPLLVREQLLCWSVQMARQVGMVLPLDVEDVG